MISSRRRNAYLLASSLAIVSSFSANALPEPPPSGSTCSQTSPPEQDQQQRPKCIAIDSSSTYLCTSNPEATRRAIASSRSGGSSFLDGVNPSSNIVTSTADMDLGVAQRIAGSEAERERIRKILRGMERYFEEEVLSRSEYEHVRGRCKNHHELCAFWSSVGECETNRGFMLGNCAAACRLCLLLHTNMMA